MSYDAMEYANRLSALKFFPARPQAVSAVAELLAEICTEEEEADRLVNFVLKHHSDWPGPGKLREIYESSISEADSQLEDCDRCRSGSGGPGLLRVFCVFEKLSKGEKHKHIVYPHDATSWKVLGDVEDMLRLRYKGSTTYSFYKMVVACSCPRGKQWTKEFKESERYAGTTTYRLDLNGEGKLPPTTQAAI